MRAVKHVVLRGHAVDDADVRAHVPGAHVVGEEHLRVLRELRELCARVCVVRAGRALADEEPVVLLLRAACDRDPETALDRGRGRRVARAVPREDRHRELAQRAH